MYLDDFNCVKLMIKEQNLEIRRLKSENEDIKIRLGYIESLAASTLGQNRLTDMEL